MSRTPLPDSAADEFAVMLSNTSQPDEIVELSERLIALIGEPFVIGDQQVEVGLSIGIALAPDHGGNTEDLLMRADLALYRAKAEGRNTACFFEPAMDKEAAERRRLENDLRRAIAHDELVLHYQPQVQGGTAKLLGFRSAGPLAAPGSRADPSLTLHPARRGDRADHELRRVGAAPGMPGGDALGEPAEDRRQSFAAAVPATRSARCDPRNPG